MSVNANDFLNEYRRLDDLYQIKNAEYSLVLSSPKTSTAASAGVPHSPKHRPVETLIFQREKLEREILALEEKRCAAAQRIDAILQEVGNDLEEALLREYYLMFETIEDICSFHRISRTTYYRHHNAGIQRVQRILDSRED